MLIVLLVVAMIVSNSEFEEKPLFEFLNLYHYHLGICHCLQGSMLNPYQIPKAIGRYPK